MHVIDYGHLREGVLYHGTISTLDGQPRSTWTFEQQGRKVTQELRLDRAAFQKLWNAVVELDAFKRNKVRDKSRTIDPAACHVVGLIYGDKEQPKRQVFLVPKDENDPHFLQWLADLNIPQGSAAAEEPEGGTIKAASRLAAHRERIYPAMFGQQWAVVAEPAEEGPPVDVYLFAPSEERGFFTLVSGGMSDAPMPMPPGSPFRRAELVMYCDDPSEESILLLQWLAQLPLVQATTWYGPGTTMTNGNPPQPIFDDSPLDCFLFLLPIVEGDNKLHEKLILEGDPTVLLWVVPISSAERRFIMERGLDPFLELLNANQHPFVLDPTRKSYV